MSKGFLRAKARVQIEGEPFTIERQCADGVWVLRNMKTERPLEQTTSELLEAYNSGRLKLEGPARAKISSAASTPSLIAKDSVPALEKGHKAASFRLIFVKAVIHLPKSKSVYGAAIQEVASSQNVPADKIPSWVSVYRWARAYLNSGSAPNVLVASNIDKGNRAPRFAEPVLEICQQAIETKFLTLERGTIVDTLAIARAETKRANKLLSASEQLSLPTYRLINRLVNDIPIHDRDLARYGREHARKKYRTSLHHRQTEAPLERGEMDHTRMDLFVIDDINGLPLGRPWLTILIDDYTRCVLGYCLSFEPPSRATVARCLRHAFMPKAGLRERYPDLRNDWDAYGVVSELVMDGGTEFHSKEIEQICFDLDIEQHFAPRKTPWFKGKVERFQGTLNRGVTVSTPGKTFSGIVERDDYDPKKHAVVAMSALKHLLVRWIADVYHQKTHSSLGCSPAQMWKSGIREHDIPLMDDPAQFDAIVGAAEKRVLSHKGIERAGLLYNSPEMGDVRRTYGARIDVDIRANRSNLGSIIVLHPERGSPIRVTCTRPDYAEGLTEWQHNVCKKHARDTLKASTDVDAWLDSLIEISDIVSAEMKLGKRKGATRERMARWNEGKQAQDVVPLPAKDDVQFRPEPTAAMAQGSDLLSKAITGRGNTAGSVPEVQKIERKRFVPVIEDRGPQMIDLDRMAGQVGGAA